MASVKYGSIVTEIKGKVGGQTFQSSKAGFSLKNNGRKNKSDATIDDLNGIIRRTSFSSVTKSWSQLSDSERASWLSLVGTWTFINKFGDVYNASAYQIYCAANINRRLLELAQLTNSPAYLAAYDPGASYTDFSISGVFEGSISNALAETQKSFIQVTWYGNPTQQINKLRIAASLSYDIPAVGTTSLKALIQSFFGGNPPLGSVFYIKVWTCWASYPKAQFYKEFKINVVA